MRTLAGLTALALLLSGCSQVRYLAQAAGRQLDLLVRARPIAEVIANPATDPETRRKLELVRQVREFALTELGLSDHGAFTDYVDVGRPAVVWNVFAAPPDSVTLRTSCFPVAGCVAYRGYFSEAAARADAAERQAAGDDVSVGAVSAYSTLGLLQDPLLSTMLSYPDASLIRTVIHELAHPALYLKDDTTFNESFAVSVEEEGMRRYLDRYGSPELRQADRVAGQRAEEFQALLLRTRGELAELYALNLPAQTTKAHKTEVLVQLQNRYAVLKASWDGYSGYDGWFRRGVNNYGVNNASLGAVSAYATLVPDFQALLERQGGSIPAFIRAAAACARRPQAERARCLRGE